jgi:two-component system, OmpR family, sensor kinase
VSSRTGRLGPYRIALRIYLATVAAVIVTGIAVAVIVRVAFAPPERWNPMEGEARYAAAQLGARWDAPAEARAQVDLLRTEGRLMATVYAADGALVAAGGERPAAPLSPAERAALAREGGVERTHGCESRHCVAVPVVASGTVVGTLVLEHAEPPRPIPRPPPWALPLTLVLVGLGVAAVLLGSGLARPLDRVAQTARALGAGDLSARTGLSRRDEVGTVARAIDDMADRVEALVRAQTELIANVAHELRTPLARIRVALDLAEDGDADVARESLAEIGEDLGELERLVNDILASARMDLARNEAGTGAPPLRVAALDVRDVVAGAADRLRQRHPARSLVVEVDPGLPPVDGDAVLLRRALDNLLDNARKYSAPEHAIRVRAARRGDVVVVEVIDRGDGIRPDDLSRLFTPFFRADPSRARATGGVGLGLALARRIVEAHGGTLLAESTRGVGTTMTIALPASGMARRLAPP